MISQSVDSMSLLWELGPEPGRPPSGTEIGPHNEPVLGQVQEPGLVLQSALAYGPELASQWKDNAIGVVGWLE